MASKAEFEPSSMTLDYFENSAPAEAEVSASDERRLHRKLDIRIVPVMMLLYLVSFLDRVNIGNARLYGLEDDLNLKGDQYQLCVSIFFVTYYIGQTAAAEESHKADVKDGLKVWKVWIIPLGHFCTNLMFYGFSIFPPTILNSLGTWTVPQIQSLTIPVYVAGAGTYLCCAVLSGRTQLRAIPLAWFVVNQPRFAKRALASGLQMTVGNSAGIAAPFLYGAKYAPLYRIGYTGNIAVCFTGMCIYYGMHFCYRRKDILRAMGVEDSKVEGLTEAEIAELGDKNPRFRYTI